MNRIFFYATTPTTPDCQLGLGGRPAFSPPAPKAAEYTQLQPQASKITFDYQQMGVGMQGVFKTFSGQLRFDPAHADKASAVLEVDLASVDVDNDEANDELATKTWFNTPAFPKARFESTSVKALPTAGQYEVVGTLTIKGQK